MARVLSRQEAAATARRLKDEGKALVFANGAFDLLHVGHVRYLESARREGDFLLVAVNSDSSVRALKGEGRPVVPEGERAEIVAALGCVDAVVIFSETSPANLIEEIRPAVHAKGTDYTEATVPERAVAERLGIRTVITGDPKAHASRDIVARVRRDSSS
jgi:rfaE bifunctional protein nucleotidyltransferase chain/domain